MNWLQKHANTVNYKDICPRPIVDGNEMNKLMKKRHYAKVINQIFILLVTLLIMALCQVMLPSVVDASIPNQLYRVDIRHRKEYTHISVKLQDKPNYSLLSLPGNRLRIVIHETDGPLFRKFKRYSDTNIGGLVFARRGPDMMITFRIAAGTGWRDPVFEGLNAITLDVGKSFNPGKPHPFVLGREKIWSGVEKLVRDFDPPLKTEIPFIPTDRQILKSILDEDDQKLFSAAESALYKGRFSEVEGIFTQFASRQSPIKPLALYRLGETLYKLQKYPQALAAFREGERLWPAFLDYNPGAAFYYGDSIARSGDLTGGRALMAHLIDRLADKGYASPLLVRMADVLVRQGRDMEALAIYRTVAENFKENKSHQMAQLRLADREFMSATPWNYKGLIEKYQEISTNASDITIREESNFKEALLAAIHGGAPAALKNVLNLQKIFPRGVYAAICRTIREVLVSQVYRETDWTKDEAGLVRFVEEHQDYLAVCLEQPGFLQNVTQAYEEAGRPIELIKIFSTLLERQWASAGAPYMLEQIADRADILGDSVLAEKTFRAFLRKYPGHADSKLITERLAGLYYAEGKHQKVKDTLLWLLNKGEHAIKPASYYYLGRSLWQQNAFAQAAKAMDLYVASWSRSAQEGVRLMPDAFYIGALAREASGDRKGALNLLDYGINLPVNAGNNDRLLYKAGEISLNEGKKQSARGYFEKIAKNSKDPEWQKLAQQSLNSIGNGASK